jgi:hypothetical protein
MQIAQLTDDDRATLRAQYASRYPEVATIKVPGEGGGDVSLQVVIGNPSGACSLPAGAPISPAWKRAIGVTMKVNADDDDGALLAADCLLWPNRKTWDSYVETWPAIEGRLLTAVRQKIGGTSEFVSEVAPGDALPESIASALSANARSVARKLTPRGAVMFVALQPPEPAPWRSFVDLIKKPDADPISLVNDIVRMSVKAVTRGDSAATFDDLLRWPGLILVLLAEISVQAGAAAKIELGEL